ncbi:class I SAM-dependent methyltransferase [Candidatus Pelagibacter sp.]|nr:class I SAM-dependent methyltransferase [Candidatus Pelagibacter sp.]
MKKKSLLKFISPEVSRNKFTEGNKNFVYLVNKRLKWMKKYTKNKSYILEFGSSNCLSKLVLGKKVVCTDIIKNKFINFTLDMNKLDVPKKYNRKYDVLIFNHCLHHSKNPLKVLQTVSKKMIKKNGFILINEPETSFVFKIFLKLFNHERYDEDISNKNNKDFWYENNSTGKLLFGNMSKNEKFLNDYKIITNELSEFFIFLNCSGNGVNTPYIPMNFFFLKIINCLDHFLIKIVPSIFALNRKIILKKIN